MRGILLCKVRPLFRQIIDGKDRRNRAGRHACATVNTLNGIDEELIRLGVAVFVLLGVDAIDGTGVHAGGVLGADTGFCNHVCHQVFSKITAGSLALDRENSTEHLTLSESLSCAFCHVESHSQLALIPLNQDYFCPFS